MSIVDSAQLHAVAAVERLADERPGDLAVVGDGTAVTFAAFRDQVVAVDARLADSGIGAGSVVSIEFDRSVAALTCVFALWRREAAYVALDPQAPEAFRAAARRLARASHSLVPDDPAALDHVSWSVRHVASELPATLPPSPRPQDRIAYGVLTSGTSGSRRCVVVGHDQVTALTAGLRSTVYAGVGDRRLRVAMNGPLSFDTSVKQLVQLTEGHTLVLIPEDVRKDGDALRRHLADHDVDVLDGTPSMARRWLDRGVLVESGRPLVERLLIGGEAIDTELWAGLGALGGVQAFNLYGPSECTVDTTWAAISGESPRLGEPLPGVTLALEDAHGRAVADFVVGEIVIGGTGVAWGYTGDVPESGFRVVDGERLYATGDLARRHPDGSIEFIGRRDTQVKVAGVRMDLGEVEAAAREVPGVRDAAAALNDDGGLVAVIVPAAGQAPDPDAVRRAMGELLPATFVPSSLTVVDAIPLTDRGKVDRREVARQTVGQGGPALPGVEAEVAALMAEMTGGPPFERHESFFVRGATSLDALDLAARLSELRGADVDVAELLLVPTPAHLASLLTDPTCDPAGPSGPSVVEAPLPKSRAPQVLAAASSRTSARSLVDAVAAGRVPPVDAVAVTCVPDAARPAVGPGDALRSMTDGLPVLAMIHDLAHGRLGLVVVPCYASEAMRLGADLVEPAVKLGSAAGARAAALTGAIAPATDLAMRCPPRIGNAVVTSGQASTVAAMAAAWEASCRARGRDPLDEHIAVVGSGALSTSFADYVSAQHPAPADLVRVDALSHVATDGAITSIVVAGLSLSPPDLERFDRDVVIVEYGTGLSAPGASPTSRRATSGGSLLARESIDELIHTPEALQRLDVGLVAAALDSDGTQIAACSLAGLLVSEGDAPAVRGVPDPTTVASYRYAQDRLGYRPVVGSMA